MKLYRLSQVARKLNIGKDTIVDTLSENGIYVDNNPNAKITSAQLDILAEVLAIDFVDSHEASDLTLGRNPSYSDKIKFEPQISPVKFVASNNALQSNGFKRYINLLRDILEAGLQEAHTTPPPRHDKSAIEDFAEKICKAFGSNIRISKPTDLYAEIIKWDKERQERISRFKSAIKNIVKGFWPKKQVPNFRKRIRTVVPLRIFHLFSSDDENDRAAHLNLSLSVTTI